MTAVPLPNADDALHAAWDRLDDQYRWYDRRAMQNQHWYKSLKSIELAVAAGLPVAAGLEAPKLLTGGLAASIALMEGVQHLYQFHEKWISYRSIAELLQHERALFRARVDDYSGADREAKLAQTVERILSQEHTRWSSTESAAAGAGGGGAGGGGGGPNERAPQE